MLYVTYFCAVLVALINTLSVYGQVDTPSFTRQTDDNYVKITEKFRKHIVDKNELRNIDNKTDLELYPHPLSEGFLEQFEYVMLDIGGMAPRDGWININAQYDDYHGDVTEEQKKNYVIRNMDNLYVRF